MKKIQKRKKFSLTKANSKKQWINQLYTASTKAKIKNKNRPLSLQQLIYTQSKK